MNTLSIKNLSVWCAVTSLIVALITSSCTSGANFASGNAANKITTARAGAGTDAPTAVEPAKTEEKSKTEEKPKVTAPPGVVLSTTTTDLENAKSIKVTATFDTPVTGLTADKIKVENATISDFSGAGGVYTFTVTPITPGKFTVSIPPDVAKDSNGKGNTASTPLTRTDTVVEVRSTLALATSSTANSVWTVSSNGTGAKIVLDAANSYPMTTFAGAGSGGHRTFVSPYGLFIGTTQGGAGGGKVTFVSNQAATGSAAVLAVDLSLATPAIGGGSRICLTQFTVAGVEYLGAAYTGSDAHRRFYKVPIDATKAGYVDTTKGTSLDAGIGSGEWGYSCYTDRTRNYFWSKNNSVAGNITGINLATGAALPITSAPNNGFTMTGPGSVAFNLAGPTQSYSLAGATDGSLLSGSAGSVYTMAHEPISGSVFASTTASTLYAMSAKCFTSIANCSGVGQSSSALSTAYRTQAGYIGPMSSLNDGRILGLERGSTNSSVYLMALVNPNNITSGLTITKIKDVPGDTYMYSDFTGSMDVAKGSIQTIDLTQAPNFLPGISLKAATLAWSAVAGTPTTWTGLTLSVACYKKGGTVTLAALTPVAVAGTEMDISKIAGCSGIFDQVQISVQPVAANTLVFSKTVDFKFYGKQ